jgi:hypothetical protein
MGPDAEGADMEEGITLFLEDACKTSDGRFAAEVECGVLEDVDFTVLSLPA